MKIYYLISLIILIVLTESSYKLQIQDQITLKIDQIYNINTSGGYGVTTYKIDWLPPGVYFYRNQILASQNAIQGISVIRIWAKDQNESTDMKIVVLKILQNQKAQRQFLQNSFGITPNQNKQIQNQIQINPNKVQSNSQKQIVKFKLDQLNQSQKIQNSENKSKKNNSTIQNFIPNSTNKTSYTVQTQSKKTQQSVIRQRNILTTNTIIYTNNRYPQVKTPNIPDIKIDNNKQEQIINSSSSTQIRQEINKRNMALKSASQNHQNAIKAITEILQVINQAKADKNEIKKKIQQFVHQYNDALKKQKLAHNKIIKIENKVTHIQQTLQDTSKQVVSLIEKILNMTEQGEKMQKQKIQLLDRIIMKQKNKSQSLNELEQMNQEITVKLKELNLKREQNQKYETDIKYGQKQLTKNQLEYDNIKQKRVDNQQYIKNKSKDVQILRKKLFQAEQDLKISQINLVNIIEQETELPLKILKIQNKLQQHNHSFNKSKQEIQFLLNQINVLKTKNTIQLLQEIQKLQDQLINERNQIKSIDSKIAQSVQPLQNFKVKIYNIQKEINILKSQLLCSQTQLNQAYIQGKKYNILVFNSKQKLQEANQKYKSLDKILSQAILDLQRNRIQEELIKLTFQELISSLSNTPPYVIVSDQKFTSKTQNNSNENSYNQNQALIQSKNHSYKNSSKKISTQYRIQNWKSFLQKNFGYKIRPSSYENISKLYSFTTYQQFNQNRVYKPISYHLCGGFGKIIVRNGKITKINNDGFNVKLNDGKNIEIKLKACTRMMSNKKNYQLANGDQIIVKGIEYKNSILKANLLICLA